MVDPKRIPERWRYSLSNLRRSAERFDLLRLLDNSEHDEFHQPRPVEQCQIKRGKVAWQIESPVPWCMNWLQGLAQRRADLKRHKAKLTRRTSSARPDKPLVADHGTGETVGRLRETLEDPEPDRGSYDFT